MLDFSMLIVNTNRSKAYLQNLIDNKFYPKEVLILQDKKQVLPEQKGYNSIDMKSTKQILIRKIENISEYFNEKEHVIDTLEKNNIPYKIIETIDVNEIEVVESVKKVSTEYIVYSGPGGYILKSEILSQGKRFIHVHSGWLPQYRGSTTIYYSMLIDANVGCSVILLDEEIDTGKILHRKTFDIGSGHVDYDLVYDPIARASTLVGFLKNIKNKRDIETGLLQSEDGNTFYISHPVLKHLAILKGNPMC